ncbi:MAG: NupC/NupG family nucleoside CNT transporter [Bacteroidia bacterium]|nr:NupC/NupG family nucleoside CNT transporter [Bacteroidia bacterium]
MIHTLLRGGLGMIVILGIAFLLSNNRKAINYRLVLSGLLLQLTLALFILKTRLGKELFGTIGHGIESLLGFSREGGKFVFGFLADKVELSKVLGHPADNFAFGILIPTIIFVSVLVSIAYQIGLMQRIVAIMAKGMHFIMGVSGAEALSNVASAFVGQVEAQIMIKPYLSSMTKSELLASMAGSMACIAGGVMAIYISMGVKAEYLLAASLMAAPGALVISKIVFPETEESVTKGKVSVEVKKEHSNLIGAIAHGCSDGLKISLNVIAMLVGFLALIALINGLLKLLGGFLFDHNLYFTGTMEFTRTLSLENLLGILFSGFAWIMGVASSEMTTAGSLLGTKFVANEFVAYSQFTKIMGGLSPKTITILSFALCGFANLGSIGIQIGGIGELAPDRKKELAQLGFKALLCGTLASYLSATIAGMLIS